VSSFESVRMGGLKRSQPAAYGEHGLVDRIAHRELAEVRSEVEALLHGCGKQLGTGYGLKHQLTELSRRFVRDYIRDFNFSNDVKWQIIK
jgi:hypothetical protein